MADSSSKPRPELATRLPYVFAESPRECNPGSDPCKERPLGGELIAEISCRLRFRWPIHIFQFPNAHPSDSLRKGINTTARPALVGIGYGPKRNTRDGEFRSLFTQLEPMDRLRFGCAGAAESARGIPQQIGLPCPLRPRPARPSSSNQI
jgi:hypothetical protein